MESINNRQLTVDLLKNFTKKLEYLSDDDRIVINKLGLKLFGSDLSELYNINECIVNGQKSCEGREVSYKNSDNIHNLIIKDNVLQLQLHEIREIIVGLIDILDEILPLGTVVKLKKEYIKKLLNNSEIENAEVVIVNRFIFNNGVKAYFPYAGVVYPLGFVGNSNAIQFSSALIDEVVHRGYSDEKDEVFTFLLKRELIIDKNMHSFGFASEEEREAYNKIIEKKGREND